MSGLELCLVYMLADAKFDGKDEAFWINQQLTGLLDAAERFIQTPAGAAISLPIGRIRTLATIRHNVMHGILVDRFTNMQNPSSLMFVNARRNQNETVDAMKLDAISTELDDIAELIPWSLGHLLLSDAFFDAIKPDD